VVQGIVTDVNDPQGLGRVQLQFPWLDPSYRSTWVPIATPLAGKKRGQFFMPEVGDEVLAAFERGDVDHPFVVGFLWNGVDTPPETDLTNRVILTPGGHTLRFEDGNKKITLKSKGGHEVTLDDSSAKQSIIVTTPGSQQLELSDLTQSIKLQGGGRSIEMIGGFVKIT